MDYLLYFRCFYKVFTLFQKLYFNNFSMCSRIFIIIIIPHFQIANDNHKVVSFTTRKRALSDFGIHARKKVVDRLRWASFFMQLCQEWRNLRLSCPLPIKILLFFKKKIHQKNLIFYAFWHCLQLFYGFFSIPIGLFLQLLIWNWFFFWRILQGGRHFLDTSELFWQHESAEGIVL